MEDSKEHLQWQTNKLKEKYKEMKKDWQNEVILKNQKIDCLQTKVQILEEEVKTANKKEKELKITSHANKVNNKKHDRDMKCLHELAEEQAKTIKTLKKEIQDLTKNVSALENTVKEKNKVIENENLAIAALKKATVSYM